MVDQQMRLSAPSWTVKTAVSSPHSSEANTGLSGHSESQGLAGGGVGGGWEGGST